MQKDLPSAKELRRRLDIRAHAAAAAAHATASGDLDSMPEWKKRKMSSASQADTPIVVRVEISPKIPLRGVWYHLVPFLRITTCLPKHVPIVRGMFERTGSLTDAMPPLKCYEADVPFPIRFLVDRGITGCDWIRIPKVRFYPLAPPNLAFSNKCKGNVGQRAA